MTYDNHQDSRVTLNTARPDARPDRRSIRSAAKRRNLIAAARHVFHDKGYTAATIENIINRAGGSRGTIYVHFSSKLSLLETVIREDAEHMARAIDETLPAVTGSVADPALLAHRLVAALAGDQTIALLRIVIAEQRYCPTIGEIYRAIVLPAHARVLHFLDQYQTSGAVAGGETIQPLSPASLLADIQLALLTGLGRENDKDERLSATTQRLTCLLTAQTPNTVPSSKITKEQGHEPGKH